MKHPGGPPIYDGVETSNWKRHCDEVSQRFGILLFMSAHGSPTQRLSLAESGRTAGCAWRTVFTNHIPLYEIGPHVHDSTRTLADETMVEDGKEDVVRRIDHMARPSNSEAGTHPMRERTQIR